MRRMAKTYLLSTAEAADRAGVSVRTLHRWVDRGRITPAAKLPGATGAYVFTPESVDLARLRPEPTEAAS